MNSRQEPIEISDTEDEDEVLDQRSAKRPKTQSQQLNDDDDDDDIVEVAANPAASTTTAAGVQPAQQHQPPLQQQPAPIGVGGLSGIDRVALEQARRERQKQRRRDAGLPSDDEDDEASSSAASKPALRPPLAKERFWQGSVKRSFNRYTGDGVRLSDLILPTTRAHHNGLQAAIVSSFDWDVPHLADIWPTAGPTTTFIMQESASKPAGLYREGFEGLVKKQQAGWEILRVKERVKVEPGKPTWSGLMHIKMMLLVYPDRLRLIVSSGNFTRRDWEHLENAAYIQDFPLLPASPHQPPAASSAASIPQLSSSSSSRERAQDVQDQLSGVLRGLDVAPEHPVFRALGRYDFAAGPTLIASIPRIGYYKGVNQVRSYGLGRLAEKAREILGDGAAVEIEAQGSSMSECSQRWLQQFGLVAAGRASPSSPSSIVLPDSKKSTQAYIEAMRQDTAPSGGSHRAQVLKRRDDTSSSAAAAWPPLKVLFPTRRFVISESKEGPVGATCHFGKPEKSKPWRHLCYQPVAERHAGLLMHHKGLLVVKEGVEEGQTVSGGSGSGGTGGNSGGDGGGRSDDECVGYVVLSSANFGKNAWGNLSLSKEGDTQLFISNWELGVLLPLHRGDLRPEARLTTDARSVVSWERPAKPYGPQDEPWKPPERK